MLGWLRAPAALASCSKRRRRSVVLREVGVDDLERHVAREPLVAGAVDLAHPALAEEAPAPRTGPTRATRGEARRAAHRDRSASRSCCCRPTSETPAPAGPMQISSPSASSAAAVSRWPRRNVPFLLPRSSSTAFARSTTIRAWWRDTRARSMTTRASEARPSRFSPRASGMCRSRPDQAARRRRGPGPLLRRPRPRRRRSRSGGPSAAGGAPSRRHPSRTGPRPPAGPGSSPRRSCPARAARGSPAWEGARPLREQQLEELEGLRGEGLQGHRPSELPRVRRRTGTDRSARARPNLRGNQSCRRTRE